MRMSIQKILVPVADPAVLGPAVTFSVAFARPMHASVTLLHVVEGEPAKDESHDDDEAAVVTVGGLTEQSVEPGEMTVAAQPAGDGEAGELETESIGGEAVDMAEHKLVESLEQIDAPDVPISTMVVSGDPAERIVSTADVAGFDMVVMEGIRTSRLAKMLFGSTAEDVKRSAGIPVVVLRQDDESGESFSEPPATLIVPLDMEPDSEHVVPKAQDIAKRLDAKIEFVHAVLDSIAVGHPAAPIGASITVADDALEAEAKEYLAWFVEDSESKGIAAGATVGAGNAINVVSEVASNSGPSLIVTDSSDRPGLIKLIFGSVPDDLVNNAGSPVMVIPGP